MRTSKVKKNILYLFIIQGLNYILPLVSVPYLTRTLGLNNFGIYSFFFALAQFITILVDYGFNYTGTRQIALLKNNNKKFSRLFSDIMLIKFSFLVIIFVIGSLFLFLPELKEYKLSFYSSLLIALGNIIFPIWVFQGMEQMKYITFLNILAKILSTGSLFLFIHQKSDYNLALIIQSIGFIISGVVSIYLIKKLYKIKFLFELNINRILGQIKEGKNVFIAQLSGSVFGNGCIFLTGILYNPAAAGYVALAQKIEGSIVGLAQPVAQGLYPHLCKLYENKDYSNFFDIRKKVLVVGFGTGLFLGLAIMLFSQKIIFYATGSENISLLYTVRIFSMILVLTIINVLLNAFILSMNKNYQMKKMYIIAMVAYLLSTIFLTNMYGSIGTALCLFLVATYLAIVSIKITRNEMKINNLSIESEYK